MIRLRPDCLAFKSSSGDSIPCTAEQVVIELIGDAAQWLDKDVVRHAAQAVLHFFRTEKGQETVSFSEFVEALEHVLRGLGLDIKATPASDVTASGAPAATGSTGFNLVASGAPTAAAKANANAISRRVVESDLQALAGESAGGAELFFFPRLRDEVHRRLDGAPLVLLFRGLRACVKQVVGVKRWNPACQAMNDQIVEYLRTCLNAEAAARDCSLVVL
jgi:hypothetical protein